MAKAEVCVARNDMECCVHALDGAPRTARLERVLEACRAKLQPQKRASTAAAKAVTKAVRPTPVRPAAKTGRSPRTAKSSSGAKRSHIVREVPWD